MRAARVDEHLAEAAGGLEPDGRGPAARGLRWPRCVAAAATGGDGQGGERHAGGRGHDASGRPERVHRPDADGAAAAIETTLRSADTGAMGDRRPSPGRTRGPGGAACSSPMSEAAADSLRAYVSAPARAERERQPGERPGVAGEVEIAAPSTSRSGSRSQRPTIRRQWRRPSRRGGRGIRPRGGFHARRVVTAAQSAAPAGRLSLPGLSAWRHARPGPVRPVDAGRDRRARASHAAAGRRVMSRRGDAAIMCRRSDASATRNDSPSAAAVERVLWARRHLEARPPAARVAVPIVTGATCRVSGPGWSLPWGHSLGRTPSYWAASGPTPGT